MTGAMAWFNHDQNAWTDDKEHYYSILPSAHGWTVKIISLNADGTWNEKNESAGEYTTEDEAWAAAKERAERSAADTQEY